jgi:hypothetical protein
MEYWLEILIPIAFPAAVLMFIVTGGYASCPVL